MNRTSIIALLIFGAILGYFLSFGPDSTRKFQAGIYQLIAPFLTSGSGLHKQITSVRSGLKTLEELERYNTELQVENRQLKATNQALRDAQIGAERIERPGTAADVRRQQAARRQLELTADQRMRERAAVECVRDGATNRRV